MAPKEPRPGHGSPAAPGSGRGHPIYLDHNATTPVDPRVLEAMLPYFSEEFGNAASRSHAYGWRAQEAVELARRRVAELIGARPREIVFTSGATEADNLAILGRVADAISRCGVLRPHVITSSIEHHAVLDPCRRLATPGSPLTPECDVTFLRPDRQGRILPEQVEEAITERTVLVSIMAAHNEIGTIYPIARIGALCRERGITFHTDAAQAAGKLPIDVERDAIDLLSISGHKLHGPKGIGALFLRGRPPRARLSPLLHGGGHERGLRPGTLDVPAIVGLGAACRIAAEEMAAEAPRLTALARRLDAGIRRRTGGVHLNGPEIAERLPGSLNLSFEGVPGEALVAALAGDVAISSGSACTSSQPEPSYVLRAIGVGRELAHASIRFGIGRYNTEEHVDLAAERVGDHVARLRTLAAAVGGDPPASS